jgi:hypothetical protein
MWKENRNFCNNKLFYSFYYIITVLLSSVIIRHCTFQLTVKWSCGIMRQTKGSEEKE